MKLSKAHWGQLALAASFLLHAAYLGMSGGDSSAISRDVLAAVGAISGLFTDKAVLSSLLPRKAQ